MRTLLVALVLFGPRVVAAQELDAPRFSERLHFLEDRIRLEAQGARRWEIGWTAVYAVGIGYGAYFAISGNHAEQIDGVVGACKSLAGVVTNTLLPLGASSSDVRLARLSDTGPGARVALGETLLRRNADEADRRYGWRLHLISLAVNLAGGAIVWAVGQDWRTAVQSTAIAVAVGELSIWTLPWRAKRDLREYRERFGGLSRRLVPDPVQASVPSTGGRGLRVGLTGVGLSF